MGKVTSAISSIFKFHKLKIFSVLMIAVVFALLLFPYDDLSDLVTEKISTLSNGTWYVQFEGLDLSFLPPMGVKMQNVVAENSILPQLKVDRLSIMPWLLGAITARQGVSIDASGLWSGAIAADYREGDKLKSGQRLKNIAIDAQGVQLAGLMGFLSDANIARLTAKGSLTASTQMQIDTLFDEQPKGAVNLTINSLALPTQTLSVNFNGAQMPVPLPEINFGNSLIDAKMEGGQIELSKVHLGDGKGDLAADATGTLGLQLRRDNSGVTPILNTYDLKVTLNVKREFIAANEGSGLGVVFSLIKQYRQADTAQGGAKYAFRIKGAANSPMPQISAIQ